MKRILISILVCILGALSLQAEIPWTERKESAQLREDNIEKDVEKAVTAQKINRITLLPKILAGQTVKINIETSANDAENTCNTAKQRITQSYHNWFNNALNAIHAQQREEEFADVLPALNTKVSLALTCVLAGTENPQTDADMTFAFKDLDGVAGDCESGAIGCFHAGEGNQPMKMVLFVDSKQNDLDHEVGHSLGLGEGDTWRNASPIYRSKYRYKSIMYSCKDCDFTNDDADGLINMIDSWNIYALKKQYPADWEKHISERVWNGWKGLDRFDDSEFSKEFYKMGTAKSLYEKQQQEKSQEKS